MTTAAGLNWAGNYEFQAPRVHTPSTVADVQQIVASAARVRAVGTKHSFNDIADSAGDLVSLVDLPPEVSIAPDARSVTVAAGTRYGVLASALQNAGYALHNMGSLPHISVGGATATGTHGSGNLNGNLSTAVSGLELVSGRGGLVTVTRDDPSFAGMVVGLGAFGIVTRLTLDIQPTFDVRQDLYVDLPWAAVLSDFEAISSSAYSVSLFTNWLGDTLGQVWLKTVVRDGSPSSMPTDFFGASPAPISVSSPAGSDNTTVTGGVVGPWSERLPHFRLDSTPSNGDEIQSEFFVERSNAAEALTAIRNLGERIEPHLLVTELRTMSGDGLWMSPANGRDSLAIHFTWKNEPEAVLALLPDIEAALAPFAARPHWGKVHTMDASSIVPLYARTAEFVALADSYDPDHQFRNTSLQRVLRMED